jgi:predicted permease
MKILRQLRSLLRKREFEGEMSDEMRHHVDLQTERNIATGMNPDEARYLAQRQFGNVASIQERARAQRAGIWLESFFRDFFQAGRMMRRNYGFTLTAVVSLALCIGANVAIFSMLYALVLKPLPFHAPSKIVEIYNSFPKVKIDKLASNLAQYFDYKQNAEAFSEVGLWRLDDSIVGDVGETARVPGAIATAEMFDLLGVKPLLGHFFTPENHVPGAEKVVVLTQSYWSARFQNDPHVLGHALRIDGEPFEIIGVAPAVIESFDPQARFIRPLTWKTGDNFSRLGYSPTLYARLKSSATVSDAYAQAVSLEKRFHDGAPQGTRDFLDRTGHVIRVDTVQSQRTAPVRDQLFFLQGGALFVLLIGCVNVAALSLARSNARRGEFAMRMALGAGRAPIVRQLLVESTLLVILGTAGGVALAGSCLGAMNHFTAQLQSGSIPFGFNGHVFAFAGFVAVILSLIIGTLPVVRVLGSGFSAPLHGQGRGTSQNRTSRAASGVLVVMQTAIAFVLLMGAGLLLRSFFNAVAVKPGFDPRQLINARIAVPADKERSFPPRLEQALSEIPGIDVSLASSTPFVLIPHYQVSMQLDAFGLRAYPLPAGAPQPSIYRGGVSLSYLRVMHIPLLQGRWFNESDKLNPRTTVVDESFANRYFPGRSAIGQRIVFNSAPPGKEEDWLEIIGVVGNVRHNGIEDRSGLPFAYMPLSQMSLYGTMSVFIRTDRSLAEVSGLLRKKIAAIDPTLPIVAIEPMAGVINESLGNRRGIVQLIGSFAGLALLLSAVGIYGVLSYDVSRRTKEIGVRSAVGATRAQIAGMVIRQGMKKTILGLLIGLAGAATLSRFATSLLFEVKPNDPSIYAAGAAVLLAVAFLATWIPARRAAKVDPVIALRAE